MINRPELAVPPSRILDLPTALLLHSWLAFREPFSRLLFFVECTLVVQTQRNRLTIQRRRCEE